MLGMIVSLSFRMLDSTGYSKKNFLTLAVIIKILSLLQHLHFQIDLYKKICIACHTLFKDHMYTCQWSDTGPPGPLVSKVMLPPIIQAVVFLFNKNSNGGWGGRWRGGGG